MKYVVTLNDTQYEVEVEKGQATVLSTAPVAAAPVAVPVAAPAIAPTPTPEPAPVAIGSGEPVTAPMPGTILNIPVTNGAAVKAGDILLILEAMKMENEIVAPRDGVISQIAVNKGATVNTGDVLIMLG